MWYSVVWLILTRFWDLLEMPTVDTLWPFPDVGCGKARYGSWRTIANYLLTCISSKCLRVRVVDQVAHELNTHLVHIWPRFSPKFIYLTRWTTGPLVLYWFHVPEPAKEASWCLKLVHNFSVIFPLKFLSDLSVRNVTCLAGCIGRRGVFKLCSSPGSTTSWVCQVSDCFVR